MASHKREPARAVRWSAVQEAVVGLLIGLAVVIVVVGALMLTTWMQEH